MVPHTTPLSEGGGLLKRKEKTMKDSKNFARTTGTRNYTTTATRTRTGRRTAAYSSDYMSSDCRESLMGILVAGGYGRSYAAQYVEGGYNTADAY